MTALLLFPCGCVGVDNCVGKARGGGGGDKPSDFVYRPPPPFAHASRLVVASCTCGWVGYLHQVFGKVMLCKTLDKAEEVAVTYKFTGITVDGQKAKPKGEYEGGFHDGSRSVFVALAEEKRCQATIQAERAVEAELKQVRWGWVAGGRGNGRASWSSPAWGWAVRSCRSLSVVFCGPVPRQSRLTVPLVPLGSR